MGLPPSAGDRVAHAVAPSMTPTAGLTYQHGSRLATPTNVQDRSSTPPRALIPGTSTRFENGGVVPIISLKNPWHRVHGYPQSPQAE